VTRVAIGEQALLDGDASLATHAAEQGILASPYDERLYRLLMRRVRRPGQPRRHPICHGTACGCSRGRRRTTRVCAPETRALYEAPCVVAGPESPPDAIGARRSSGSSAQSARGVREPRTPKPGIAGDLADHRRRFDHRP